LQRTTLHALAEGLVTQEEAEQLTGEKLELVEPLSMVERRALAKLPVDERRRVLAEQAARIAEHYEHDEQWRDLDGGDVVEY
jgi:flagellar biosynthesis/type III secretory pathway chaperone